MGEVIALVLVLIIVVSVLGGGAYFVVGVNRSHRPEVDSQSYKNHLALARWVEHCLADDMVRPIIPEVKQQSAKKLLAEFYDDHF